MREWCNCNSALPKASLHCSEVLHASWSTSALGSLVRLATDYRVTHSNEAVTLFTVQVHSLKFESGRQPCIVMIATQPPFVYQLVEVVTLGSPMSQPTQYLSGILCVGGQVNKIAAPSQTLES
jgi:hypothetical protein